jgi:hypothetical protein
MIPPAVLCSSSTRVTITLLSNGLSFMGYTSYTDLFFYSG